MHTIAKALSILAAIGALAALASPCAGTRPDILWGMARLMAGEPRFIGRMASSAAVWLRAKWSRAALRGNPMDAEASGEVA